MEWRWNGDRMEVECGWNGGGMGIEEGWSGVDGDGMGLDRAVESSGMCSGSANLRGGECDPAYYWL